METALEISGWITAGEVKPSEVMQQTLARVQASNGQVNAIVSLRDEDALMAEALAADQAAPQGWLHGIPIAIKDLSNAAGVPTSQGSPLFAGQVAARDDIMVARLRAAGAIVIGKTNTPEFGLGSQTFNPVFGATRNPYDPARSCGGSSGGAAVALATGMLAVADGSDMMGSLRNPAAWNNVYGMRPSFGLVPAEPSGETYLRTLSTNGPMARNPRDLAALLDTMMGPDPRQPWSLSVPLTGPEIAAEVSDRRIGWLGDWGGAFAMEPGVLALCEAALAAMPGQVDALAAPFDRDALWEAWVPLRHLAVGAGLASLYEDPVSRERLKDTAQWEIEGAQRLSALEVHRASSLRSDWYAAAAALFDRYDVLALPAGQVWPFAVEQDYPREIAGQGMDTYHRWMEVMVPAALIGLPVVSVPVGFGADGLPMGLQLIGRRGDDGRLLQMAEAWHQRMDWPSAHPPQLLLKGAG